MKRAFSILLAALLLLVALPTVAEEGPLKTGLYCSDAGAEFMYLNEEGVGVLIRDVEGARYAYGIAWTDASLEIERSKIPFAMTDDVLSFTYEETAFALRYNGVNNRYVLGDRSGTSFSGNYAAEDGKTLSLTPDGRGVYTDETGEKNIVWGSFLPYYEGMEGQAVGACYILFDSFISSLNFTEGAAVVKTEEGADVTFSLVIPEVEEPVQTPATITVVSYAYDLAVTLPTDRWLVEETEAGLLIAQQRNLIQYTFLSLPLEKEPALATLDIYANHIWIDSLMGVGVAFDADDAILADYTVGEAVGRRLTTEWNQDDAVLMGDSYLWYANGRLYAALCVSNEVTRPEALAVLETALLTVRTADESALAQANQLPVDKDVFEGIRELPEAPTVTEDIYYAYRMTSGGTTLDVVPLLTLMGMDPKAVCLVLRSDGTGFLQMMEEGTEEFLWTEGAVAADDQTLTFTRQGTHILLDFEEESVEFAPAEEMEAVFAEMTTKKPLESVTPAKEDIIGNWTLTKARALGMEIPAEQMGMAVSMVFNEDDTVIVLDDGTPSEMEWTIGEDGKVHVTEAGEEKYVAVYDGAALHVVIGADSLEMIFEKDA